MGFPAVRRSTERTRRLAGVLLLVMGLGLLAVEDATAADKPDMVIVSSSGIPHHDIADYTRSPRWREGMPEGMTDSWRAALDTVIGQIASEKPDAVFHTGDMVGGRWGRDPQGVGLFGPTQTRGQRRRAIEQAAALYYRQNKRWWAEHGLRPYFGVGDHEIGDMGASGVINGGSFHYNLFPSWRRAWGHAFTDDGTRFDAHPPGQHRRTAYATMVGDVGFVSLDPFVRTPGDVYTRIGWEQMRWIDDVLDDLRAQGARFLVVQCETPALGPNRQSHSSRLILENGEQLWELLKDHDVDLLLTSEFHMMTTHTDDGTTPVQVVHGGQLYRGTMNYLLIKTYDDRIELRLKQMEGHRTGRFGQIWAPRLRQPVPDVFMHPGARVVGRMTIHKDGDLSDRTGYLREGIGHMPEDTAPVQRGRAKIGTPLSTTPRRDPPPPRSVGTAFAPAASAAPRPPFVSREPPSAPPPFAGRLWSVWPLLVAPSPTT